MRVRWFVLPMLFLLGACPHDGKRQRAPRDRPVHGAPEPRPEPMPDPEPPTAPVPVPNPNPPY